MPFKFFKLADVRENEVISENTDVLVVNGEEVERTPARLFNTGGSSYKDISDDYATWAQENTPSAIGEDISVMLFVKTIGVEDKPCIYYFNAVGPVCSGMCVVEVYGSNVEIMRHAEYAYCTFSSNRFIYYLEEADFINNENIYASHIESTTDGWLKTIIGGFLNVELEISSRQGKFSQFVKLGTEYNSDNVYLSNDDGNIALSNNNSTPVKIENVGTPTANTDATNKSYVDSHDIASASVDSAGIMTFSNGNGTTLFSVQLPLYDGSVSNNNPSRSVNNG